MKFIIVKYVKHAMKTNKNINLIKKEIKKDKLVNILKYVHAIFLIF
jgi:uncharacterized membrane protein